MKTAEITSTKPNPASKEELKQQTVTAKNHLSATGNESATPQEVLQQNAKKPS